MPQSSYPNQSTRTSPPHAKRTIVRVLRPAPLVRRSTPTSPTLNSGRQASKQAEKKDEAKPDMTTSFLQYCATCERLIEVPNNSILYCSKSCRRKDWAKPILPTTPIMSPHNSPPTTPSGASTAREILPPLTPTFPVRIPAYPNHSKSDLDPTEWKPKIPRGRGGTKSEAFAYLQQFHRSTNNIISDETASSSMPSPVPTAMSPRPRVSHRSTTSMAMLMSSMQTTSTAPSLANTPTTVASSLGSINGAEHVEHAYNFNTRPLPPRHNPFSYDMAKGVELVTPHAAPANEPAIGTIEGKELWPKKVVVKKDSVEETDGKGLGALFK